MTVEERVVLERFKAMVQKRVLLHKVILFGSRARGDAALESDMDVLVVTENPWDWETREYISQCAWEAGFDDCMLIVPVVFSREEWEEGPERSSLLTLAVQSEGVAI